MKTLIYVPVNAEEATHVVTTLSMDDMPMPVKPVVITKEKIRKVFDTYEMNGDISYTGFMKAITALMKGEK